LSINNLPISFKLAGGFAAVVMTILTMTGAIFWNLQKMHDAAQAAETASQSIDIITGAQLRLANQESSFRAFLLTNDAHYLEQLKEHRAAFDAELDKLRAAQSGDANEAEVLAEIDDAHAAMDAWTTNVVDEGIRVAKDPIFRFRAIEMVGQNGISDTLMAPINAALGAMLADEQLETSQTAEIREGAALFTERALYVGVFLAVLVSAFLGWLMSRMIATPINALTGVMGRLASGENSVEVPAVERGDEIGAMAKAVLVFKEAAIEKVRLEGETEQTRAATDAERSRNEAEKAREADEDHTAISSLAAGLSALADGDLTFRITASFAPKTQKLKDDFNRTAEQLQETMATITGAIEGMRSGTGEISQAADDLSRRTEQQAASLEQTAAALDEITATVKTTADGAHRASEVTGLARVGAEKSGAVVREAVSAMAQIEKSSQQIGQIIGVIDEIAFQTNLLALNAGVEAARAGEAGKGFAVVASEVRALAQRSAEAAKEIKELISTSTQQVEQGVDLVGQTGSALEKIVAQVAEITGLVTEIAASAREQSTGLGEVNSAVNQMDQVTQQNAAMVEQSTAASHHLAQDADSLSKLVSRFKTGHQAAAPATAKSASVTRAAPAAPAAPRQTAQPAMKTVSSGSGQVAALLASQPADDGWEEF